MRSLYGGCVITDAAAGLRPVNHLVHLCAFMLDLGESAMQSVDVEVPPGSADLEHAIVPGSDGVIDLLADTAG